MPDITTVVDDYIACFNELDQQRRHHLATRVFTDDARYLDPLMAGDGPDAITEMIAGVHAAYPGTRFVLAGAPDHHHDRVRFTWHLCAAGGDAPIAVGHDFATLAPDGRLADVTGFLDGASA